jgi:four helix bundle protein
MSNSVIKEMIVYKKAYDLGMKIFKITKSFPPDEVYALTSQIRRSSRSVYLNLREAWAKRRYKKNFISKLTECDGENNETDSSLDTAKDCGYISEEQHKELTDLSEEVGKLIGYMIRNTDKYILKS